MGHSKKQNRYPEPDPKEAEASESLDKEFKTMASICPEKLKKKIDKGQSKIRKMTYEQN